jgi:predicted phage tail protein
MTKKEVLKHLDKLVPPFRLRMNWTKEEVSAMNVETYRSYVHVARLEKVAQSTIMRRCIRFINQNKLLYLPSS